MCDRIDDTDGTAAAATATIEGAAAIGQAAAVGTVRGSSPKTGKLMPMGGGGEMMGKEKGKRYASRRFPPERSIPCRVFDVRGLASRQRGGRGGTRSCEGIEAFVYV